MESNREKVSYCIGLQTGKNLKEQFKDIDSEFLIRGINDAIAEKTPALEMDEIKKILQFLQQQVQDQQRTMVEEIAEKNQNEGESFLETNKEQTGIQILDSGLQYRVLQEGEGKTPSPRDEVTVHYRGNLINGKVFDSTYERDEPAKFPVDRVIPGWSEALQLMKEGDKWQLFIPSNLAYGEGGYGPQIEPNSTLIFEMELLEVNS